MINGDGNENGKKLEKQIKQKQKQKCQVVHYTIFVHFFLHDNMKPPIYTFHEGNIVGVPVRFFFTAAQFHLGGSQHFSFSHLRYEIFMFFFNKIRLINEIICVERRTQKKILSSRWELRVFVQFFFLYVSIYLFLWLFTSVQTFKIFSRKKSFVCTGCHNIYPQNVHVLEMRNFHRLT